MNLERIIAVRNNKIVYRDENSCIKVFNSGFSKTDILNEALNHAKAEETKLNIPKFLGVNLINEKWAVVSEYINGKTLKRLMLENPEKSDEYLELFIKIQKDIHKQNSLGFYDLKNKMCRKIEMTNFSKKKKQKLSAYLKKMSDGNNLCHGELDFSNIIITSEDVPYILDWECAARGSIAADVAKTYLLLCMDENVEFAEKYLSLFLKGNKITKKEVMEWIPFNAAVETIEAVAEKFEFFHECVESSFILKE